MLDKLAVMLGMKYRIYNEDAETYVYALSKVGAATKAGKYVGTDVVFRVEKVERN